MGLTEQPVHGAQSLAVEQIIYHVQYRPKGLDYDIALMKLATSLVFNGNSVLFQDLAESSLSFSSCSMFIYSFIHSSELFYCISAVSTSDSEWLKGQQFSS